MLPQITVWEICAYAKVLSQLANASANMLVSPVLQFSFSFLLGNDLESWNPVVAPLLHDDTVIQIDTAEIYLVGWVCSMHCYG
jgi:hypothetical protein